MDTGIFLKFLSATLYGDAVDFWRQCSEEQRHDICKIAEKEHLELYCYRSLGNHAKSFLPQYTKSYFYRSASCVIEEQNLKNLFSALEHEKIRFAPIKGIDYAYRFYPSCEARFYIDWDILFHQEDCERALMLLHRLGWKTDKAFSLKKRPQCHHYPIHMKDGIYLEPHWTLPKFQKISADELWKNLIPVDGTVSRFTLSPELNILMLTRHFTSLYYTHVSIPKLLLDTAYILKNQRIDWNSVVHLAEQFHMPNPCNLLAACDEFFPGEVISQMCVNPDIIKIYRKIISLQSTMSEHNTRELEMNNFSIENCASWFTRRILAFNPARVRNRYCLPVSGAYFKLVLCYARFIREKICEFFTYFWRIDSKMRYYTRLIRKIESDEGHI